MSNRRNEKRRHKRNLKKAAEAVAIATMNIEQNHKAQKAEALPRQPLIRRHLDRAKILWAAFLAFLAVVGGLAAYYELRPQISVTAAPSINKDAPFQPLMTITNVGYLEIYNLIFECRAVQEMRADRDLNGVQLLAKNHQNSDVGNNLLPEPILRPQSSIARTCTMSTEVDGSHIESVAVTLGIHFRPSFWPFRDVRYARFRSRTGPNGQIQWVPDPKDDPYDHG
jgi:hypothetical protein